MPSTHARLSGGLVFALLGISWKHGGKHSNKVTVSWIIG